MEVVGVVVARGQNHNVLLEVHLLGSLEGDAEVSQLEFAQPAFILVVGLRVEHEGLAICQSLTSVVHCLAVLVDCTKSLVAHTVSGQETHSAESLVEYRIFEYVGTGDEVHPSVGEFQADTKGVVQAVLVVRYHDYGSTVDGYIFQAHDMLLAEI